MLPEHLALREDAGMDFEAAGLLDGLDGDRRRAREQLLERLAADGTSLEELKSAVAEHRLALLPVDRLLGGRYTAGEIEERTGVPAGLLVQQRRLLGLPKPGPEDRVFDDEDIDTAKSLKLFLDTRALLYDLLGGVGIVPESRIGDLCFKLIYFCLLGRGVKETSQVGQLYL